MQRSHIIALIERISSQRDAFDILHTTVETIEHSALVDALLQCGIIPERFAPDSSEEKLWAKYCDIVLSQALLALGINAAVLRTRGNSADVFGSTSDYTIVADAKAFRLSRTAKNQKDFKVSALDDWRRDDTYALLVGPLLQYPNTRSQIYTQAIQRNVTLLAYEHMWMLLAYQPANHLEQL